MSLEAVRQSLDRYRLLATLHDQDLDVLRADIAYLRLLSPGEIEHYRDAYVDRFGFQKARQIFIELDDMLMRLHRQNLSFNPVRILPAGREIPKLAADYGQLSVIQGIPTELTGVSRDVAIKRLSGPTAIVIDNGKPKTRVISVLVHGNEPSGFQAMLDFFNRPPKRLDVNVIFLVQNVLGAQAGGKLFTHRYHPDTQTDLNRQFLPFGTPKAQLNPYVAALYTFLAKIPNIEAFLDLHNNSGENPVYAALSYPDADQPNLELSESLAHFLTEQYLEFNLTGGFDGGVRDLAPAIAVECGCLGTREADSAANEIIDRFLSSSGASDWLRAPERQRFQIESELALASPDYAIHIEGVHDGLQSRPLQDGLFLLRPDIEFRNFRPVSDGTPLGSWVGDRLPISAMTLSREPRDLAPDYFAVDHSRSRVVLQRPASLAMATTRLSNIQSSRTGFAYTIAARAGRRFKH